MFDLESEYAEALLDTAATRISRVQQMWDSGLRDEALTLVLCYIDGFAFTWLSDEERTGRRFVAALIEHSRQPVFSLHSLGILQGWLDTERYEGGDKSNARLDAFERISAIIKSKLKATRLDLMTRDGFIKGLKDTLSPSDFSRIENDVWRGSVAFVVYRDFRTPFVHEFSGVDTIQFNSHRRDGTAPISVGFPTLYAALTGLLAEARGRLEDRNYGID